MADTTPPWIDLNVHLVWRYAGRYTHAHDFNDGKLSYYSIAFTEAQIRAWFAQLNYPNLIAKKSYSTSRTRLTVTLELFNKSTWVDAYRLREVIDRQFRKHRHEVPSMPKKDPIVPPEDAIWNEH